MKKLALILLLLIFVALLNGCAKNPVSQENQFIIISDEDEMLIGQDADIMIKEKFGVYNDPPLQAYIDEVGQKVAEVSDRKNIPYHFSILDTNMVNAFALPGGYIYVTRGILARLNNEAELANVLGHELTHITARHGAQRISQVYSYQLAWIGAGIVLKQQNINQWRQAVDLGVQLTLLGYSREHEFESDHMGEEYAEHAGYTPFATVSFLRTLQKEEKDNPEYLSWLSTHPPTNERIKEAEERAEELTRGIATADLLVLPDKYKEEINGLELGPNKKLGMINGRQYKNQYYGCKILALKNWELSTMRSNALVVLQDPEKKYTVYLQATKAEKPLALDSWVKEIEAALGDKVRKTKGFNSPENLPHYSAFYEEDVKDLGKIIERRDFIVRGNIGYIVTYLSKDKNYPKGSELFDEIFNTFAFLPEAEMKKSYSQYLTIYKVRKGDTLSGIAKNKLGSVKKEESLINFNGLDPEKELYVGQILKLPPREKD